VRSENGGKVSEEQGQLWFMKLTNVMQELDQVMRLGLLGVQSA